MRKTPSLRHTLFRFSLNHWTSWSVFKQSAECAWLLFVGMIVALATLLTWVWEPLPSDILAGSIATRDIRSDRPYKLVDRVATKVLQDEAAKAVLPMFRYDETYQATVLQRIEAAFVEAREGLQAGRSTEHGVAARGESTNMPLNPQALEDLRLLFSNTLGISVAMRDFENLADDRFSIGAMRALKDSLSVFLNKPILQDRALLRVYRDIGLQLVHTDGQQSLWYDKELNALLSVEEVQSRIQIPASPYFSEPLKKTLTMLAKSLIVPTARYDAESTEKLRQAARNAIEPVMIYVQAGESIIRRGDRFQTRDIAIIEGIKQAKAQRNFWLKFIGTSLFVACFIFSLYLFMSRFFFRFHPARRDLVCMGLGLILGVASFRLAFSLGQAVRDNLPFDLPSSALFYGIPLAAGAMVIRMIRNAQEALFFTFALCVTIALAPDMEISYLVYYLLGSLLAAGVMKQVDSRAALWKTGLVTGLAQACFVVFLELVRSTDLMVSLSFESLFWNMGFALSAGLLAALATQAFTSLAESLFGYVTDIKLLELSSLNHPLLRELIVRAPGTYHHSHMVGALAEAACRTIGANGLFARVAAYFHDIGKMTKSAYFIENQSQENRHESLAPSMSALIIQSHVKDGIELGRKYGLPEPIIDIIPQHQGTKLIRYFYSKAKEQEDPNVSTVDEKDYRYPGPRPQTRESGVILLADSVEAAVRSMSDKSPTKIRAQVEKLVNMNFTDGQLDECELTLKDLHDIVDSFTTILVGIHHRRIAYPDLPAGEAKKRLNLNPETGEGAEVTPIRPLQIKQPAK